MSSFLFAIPEGGGVVPPVLSIAGALVARGHDVRVLADPVLRPEVETVGAEPVAWVHAPHRHDRRPETDLTHDWEARTPAGQFARFRDGVVIGPAARYARDVRDELARRPADVVAAEQVLMGAQLAGRGAGVPVAVLATTLLAVPVPGVPPMGPGFMPARGPLGRLRDAAVTGGAMRMWDRRLGVLNGARAEHGLPPLRHALDQLVEADRILVLTSEAFDFAPTGPRPPNVVYTGPRLADPAWARPWTPPPGDEPLVLVSLSSTYQDQVPMLRAIADALGRLPVRGLVTAGPSVDASAVAAPPNVSVVASAPHDAVLRQAAAVIGHGGHGTTIKALAHGVPVVAVPMGRDQNDIAARVVASGAGLRVAPRAVRRRLGPALERVLAEPAFAAAARRLQAAIADDLAEDRAVDELERLAVRRASPSLA